MSCAAAFGESPTDRLCRCRALQLADCFCAIREKLGIPLEAGQRRATTEASGCQCHRSSHSLVGLPVAAGFVPCCIDRHKALEMPRPWVPGEGWLLESESVGTAMSYDSTCPRVASRFKGTNGSEPGGLGHSSPGGPLSCELRPGAYDPIPSGEPGCSLEAWTGEASESSLAEGAGDPPSDPLGPAPRDKITADSEGWGIGRFVGPAGGDARHSTAGGI